MGHRRDTQRGPYGWVSRGSCHPSSWFPDILALISGQMHIYALVYERRWLDIRRIQNVRPDATGTRIRREPFEIEPVVGTRRHVVAAEVRARVASETTLHLVQLGLACHLADEHAEALITYRTRVLVVMEGCRMDLETERGARNTQEGRERPTGLKAVTVFFLGAM